MSIKNLVEMIKHNGLLASMSELEELYQAAIENEQKLAESEARCSALAAENAGLKNALEWLYETVSSDCVSIPNEKYSSVTNAAQALSETPATDAHQAELRAQGVEMLAENHQNVVDALNGDSLFADGERRHAAIAAAAVYFAAQLRKGVQS